MKFYINNRNIQSEEDVYLVGYNADYTAEFEFDSEWGESVKTARFIQNGKHQDRLIDENNTCEIPMLKTGYVLVGVFDSTKTSTYTRVLFNKSIKDVLSEDGGMRKR